MKNRLALCFALTFSLLLQPGGTRAEDNGRNTADKARDILNKIVDEAQKASSKVEKKSKQLWEHTKENLRLTKDEYLGKTGSALVTIHAEIQAIAESDTGVSNRDYFKARIDALKLHLDFCKREWSKLKDITEEETFRVKQKGFDRTLGFLSDNVELAKDEAGL